MPRTAAKAPAHAYDESKIQTLSAVDHIRKRTGMYIGRLGDGTDYDDGIYILLKEVVDNAVDEFIMGHGARIEVTIADGVVSVRDYGRGIPHGKLVDCVSRINTGAKYNDDVFQFSVGLNGVGTKAVNALSFRFLVRSVRAEKFAQATFTQGALEKESAGPAPGEPDGTLVRFTPDPEIFGASAFDPQFVTRRMRLYTYLNPGLEIVLNGTSLVSRDGLRDLIAEESTDEALYPVLHAATPTLAIAFTHSPRFHETHFAFVNGQYTVDGGTHLSAFREGVLKAFNEFSKGHYEGDDIREGLIGAVAIRLKDPVFESQTKNKLGNGEIRGDLVAKVRDLVVDLLHRHPQSAAIALQKIAETEKLRKELAAVKKLARERARAVSIRVPQLKDCKLHFDRAANGGADSTLFITEGQSAAGSLVSCRDPQTQAIFTLKGKPLNVCDLERDAIYKNDELYNLMRALHIEDSVATLRYNRIVLATDADVDGRHIRNLLITFFLRYFEPIVVDGHVSILETPLFRVRRKGDTRYCYAEAERDAAMEALGSNCEVTRFKGLGEISPAEFKPFIGPDMRLTPVRVQNQLAVPHVLSFYMGKNTPARRRYILDNLIVDEAE